MLLLTQLVANGSRVGRGRPLPEVQLLDPRVSHAWLPPTYHLYLKLLRVLGLEGPREVLELIVDDGQLGLAGGRREWLVRACVFLVPEL